MNSELASFNLYLFSWLLLFTNIGQFELVDLPSSIRESSQLFQENKQCFALLIFVLVKKTSFRETALNIIR
jgi:hypothetical protein